MIKKIKQTKYKESPRLQGLAQNFETERFI